MHSIIPPAALNQHTAILGKTGSGKSYAAKGIVEQLLRQERQVCVIDPTAAWWGLRLAADGKARGFDVVLLGGQHADIPLAERSGSAVARLVTEQGANVVLDTSGFTVGEYTRWFIDFAGTLFTTIRNPLHLVIDEAHHFMPQGKSPDVDAGKMLHAGNRLMSGGRSKGVRGMLITQRPAKLHKDSLSCADTLIAMRVIAPQDRAAIKEWIDGAGDPKQGKEVLDSLARLQRGEGWVWYPEGGHLERVHFPKIKTYDSSATPAHGTKAGPKVAEIDLVEVQKAMAEAVKEAEANDPKLLRKKIADLECQLYKSAKSLQAKPDQGATDKAVALALQTRDRQWESVLAEEWKAFESSVVGLKDRLERIAKLSQIDFVYPTGKEKPAPPPPKSFTQQVKTPPNNPVHKTTAKSEISGELTAPQQRILDIVHMLGVRGLQPNREMVARWMGIHPNGGRYGSDLAFLRSAGYLDGLQLTGTGQAAANDCETGLDTALAALNDEPKRTIIRTLLDAGHALSREELAEALGIHPNGGRYGSNLSWLRTMGLITERGPIAPTKALFD